MSQYLPEKMDSYRFDSKQHTFKTEEEHKIISAFLNKIHGCIY